MALEEVGARLSLRGRAEFSRETERAEGDLRELGNAADRAGSHFSGLGTVAGALRGPLGLVGGIARTAAVGVTVLGGAAIAGGAALLTMASNAAETQSKFATVFGGESDEVTSWIRGIQSDVHIATQELQDAASTFGVFGQAVGVPQDDLGAFSTALAQVGLDLASFSNANPEDVFLALRSGLAGEAEPLRQFGIFLSDASLNAFAAAQGINRTTAEMTEQEKVLLRQQFILSNLGAAEGDLARTAGGVANQTRGMLGALKDVGVEVGQVLTPAAEKLLPVLTEGLGEIVDRLRDNLPDLQRRVGDWADSLVRLYRTIRDGRIDTEGFDSQIEAVFGERFGGFLNGAIDLVGTLRTNISELGTGQGLIATVEDLFGENAGDVIGRIAEGANDIWVIFRDTLIPAWQGAQETVGPLAGLAFQVLGDGLEWAAENAEALAPWAQALLVTYITAKAVGTVKDLALGFRGLATALGMTALAGGTAGGAGAVGTIGALIGMAGGIGVVAANLTMLAVSVGALAWHLSRAEEVQAAALERYLPTVETPVGPVTVGNTAAATQTSATGPARWIQDQLGPQLGAVTFVPAAPPQAPGGPASGGSQEFSSVPTAATPTANVTVIGHLTPSEADALSRQLGHGMAEEIDRVLQVRAARG